MKIKEPIAIVCHDAGSANIIISWIKKVNIFEKNVFMQGPANKLWVREYGKANLVDSLDKILERSVTLISGTGWSSDLEHMARKSAKNNNIYSIAILDHWVNYEERFIRNDEKILPDEIWVVDKYAYFIAKKHFPDTLIVQQENYYLKQQLSEINSCNSKNNKDLLYLLEPLRNRWEGVENAEYHALDFFAKNISIINKNNKISIRLRLHPSETYNKYMNWININKHLNISFDESISLSESIAKSSCVIGCHSYAMIVALEAGKKVYCSIPNDVPEWSLPHNGIIYIRDYVT